MSSRPAATADRVTSANAPSRSSNRLPLVPRSSRSASASAPAGSSSSSASSTAPTLGDPRLLRLREELPSLVEAALSPPQLTQAAGAVEQRRPTAFAEHFDRALELRLGLLPGSGLQQDGRVLGAADVEQRAELPAPRELPHLVAPLQRAVDVADPLARGDQVAADLALPHEVVEVAGPGCNRRLVETPHALLDATFVDERHPLERPADDLDVVAPERVRERDCALGSDPRLLRIAGREGDLGLAHGDPGVLRAGLLVREQPCGAVEPASRHRWAAAEEERVPRQSARDARRARRVVGGAVQAIGPLPCFERRVGVVEPPVRVPRSLERLRVVVDAADERERLLPRAA